MTTVLGHPGQINPLFLLPQPYSQSELGQHHNSSYLTIMCDCHKDLCMLEGYISIEALNDIFNNV